MKILLTNDDGIDSPGILALERAFAGHDIFTIAPEIDQSGKSHSITIHDPVRMRKRGEQRLACSGSPADCVLYALNGVMPDPPDLVISGINIGANIGTDIIYSGTAGAARQAALMGVPGIAVSALDGSGGYDGIASFVAENADRFLQLWDKDHFVNINFPKGAKPEGLRITRPGLRFYKDKLASFESPTGDIYFFLQGNLIETDQDDDTDWSAVRHNYVSLTPVYLHPVNRTEEKAYKETSFTLLSKNPSV